MLAYLCGGTSAPARRRVSVRVWAPPASYLLAVLSIVRGAPGAGGMALISCSLLPLLPLLLPVQALHPPEGGSRW